MKQLDALISLYKPQITPKQKSISELYAWLNNHLDIDELPLSEFSVMLCQSDIRNPLRYLLITEYLLSQIVRWSLKTPSDTNKTLPTTQCFTHQKWESYLIRIKIIEKKKEDFLDTVELVIKSVTKYYKPDIGWGVFAGLRVAGGFVVPVSGFCNCRSKEHSRLRTGFLLRCRGMTVPVLW